MAGKYHRTYLDNQLQEAFERMQADTGAASNAYVVRAVKAQLEQDGYLKESRLNLSHQQALVESAQSPVRRRRRRGQATQ